MPFDADDARTRAAFDVVAADYARLLPDLGAEAPLDRAVLSAFVEMLGPDEHGPVAEVGCGSGRVLRHLADAGVRVLGLDLSEGMLRESIAARDDLPCVLAAADVLPLRDGALAGLVAWYSVINLAPERLLETFSGFARACRSGAPAVLAFQSGDGARLERASAYGHAVPVTYYLHAVDVVAQAMADAGFVLDATVVRRPTQAHESTPQAFLLARRE